jgi:hypothetical protein
MTLAERILAQLEDRPLSVDRLAKSLSLRPMQRPELNRELTLLHRAKRIIYGRGEWSIADVPPTDRADAPFDPVPATEESRPPRPNSPEHHATAKDRRAAILTMLEGGEMARKDIAERLGLDSQDRNLDNALGRLRAAGQITQVSRGIWALGDTPQSDLKTALKRMLDTNPAASADAGPNEPGPLVDETDQLDTVDAPTFIGNTIADVADRYVERGKFDKPKQTIFRIQPGTNGFIVYKDFSQVATDPPGVFNHFDDLVAFLREEYFA